MKRDEAIARLRAMNKLACEQAQAYATEPEGPWFDADADALALAIRALELLGDVAACDNGYPTDALAVKIWFPRATWDAVREIAG